MDIVIRESLLEDAAMVHNDIPEFEQRELAYFYERIKERERLVLVAYEDEEPAGYMIAYELDEGFYCWLTGVMPDFRKKGVMKRMMAYVQDWAKLRGYKKLIVKTRNKRRIMLRYLIRNGFNVVKISRRPDEEENRILMEKKLS